MPSPIYSQVHGNITPLPGHIIVTNMERGDTILKSGLLLPDDNGKNRGIRPRWCQVYKVGTKIDWLEPGQWILVEHGRWTYGIDLILPEGNEDQEYYIQRVEPEAILLVTDEYPLV